MYLLPLLLEPLIDLVEVDVVQLAPLVDLGDQGLPQVGDVLDQVLLPGHVTCFEMIINCTRHISRFFDTVHNDADLDAVILLDRVFTGTFFLFPSYCQIRQLLLRTPDFK